MLKLKPKYGLCGIFRRFSAKKEYQKKVDFNFERTVRVVLKINHK